MNVVLIFSVLILIAIAIWQVTKIFELSQAKKVYTQVADDKDNDWNGKLMFAFLIFIYGLPFILSCLMEMYYFLMQLRNTVQTTIT